MRQTPNTRGSLSCILNHLGERHSVKTRRVETKRRAATAASVQLNSRPPPHAATWQACNPLSIFLEERVAAYQFFPLDST